MDPLLLDPPHMLVIHGDRLGVPKMDESNLGRTRSYIYIIEVFLNFDVYTRIIYKLFLGTISTYLFHSLDQIWLHHKVLAFSKKFYLRGGMENDLGRGWYRIPVKRIIPIFFKKY